MNNSTANMLIPKTKYGSIDIDAVSNKYYEGFWEESFVKAGSKEIYSSPKRAIHKEYFIDNAEDIINAINLWLSSANVEIKDKKEERRLNNFLTNYLYRGDISLGLQHTDKSTPKGLSALIANCIVFKRELRSLYFHYQKIATDSNFSDAEKRFTFAKIILENLRLMLADIWNYDFFLEKLKDENSKYDLIKIIEANFCDYLRLCPPVRCIRILKMLKEQNALPELKAVKERQHLLACFLEKSLKLKGNDIISEFIEELSPYWEKHIAIENLNKEKNPERFNTLMTQIIENLTFGDLKEAEHRKNRESGENARNIRRELKKCENLLLSNNMTLNDYKLVIEKKKFLETKLNMINGISLSLEDDSVGSLKIDVPYCPDDYSDEIWENLNEDTKLFLITTELCDNLKIKTGYKALLQKKIKAHISCIPINIVRAILSKITNKELEPANVSTKNDIKKETQKLMNNPTHFSDVSYTLQRIMDTKVRNILAGKAKLDFKTSTMLELACDIVKELKNKE